MSNRKSTKVALTLQHESRHSESPFWNGRIDRLRFLRALLFANLLLTAMQATSPAAAQSQPNPVAARWTFRRLPDGAITEEVSGNRSQIVGLVRTARSPVGQALQFDGYTGKIVCNTLPSLDNAANLGVSAWIQLEAYPWNRVPILDQADAQGSFFFGLDAEGHLLARLRKSDAFYVSKVPVPLRKWTLITLSINADQVAFTIDGVVAPSAPIPIDTSDNISGDTGNLLIGHVRSRLLPGPSRMIHPQLPVEYSIQGSLGELTVYNQPLSVADAGQLFARADERLLQPLSWPEFPRWQGGSGPFGAYYTTLAFDPLWDDVRRIGPDSDVVVRFDNAPIQLIFWQGNNYVPAWVTENNRWYTDEFAEVYGQPRCPYGEDCEPMSDKQARYSHVRIIESTPARVVVDWRYALSEVEKYAIADARSPTDWGDWADEYWTVYPDGIAVRRSVLWSTAAQREKTEFQESIVLIPPGETPEDNVNLDALTFANLLGQTKTYAWSKKSNSGFSLPQGPPGFSEPKDAVIQWVNLRSTWKPFEVAWGAPVKFDAYNSELSISSFEWWNHWPVAQIPSSGRPAFAADRPGHTSVSHIYWPAYRQDDKSLTKILLTGLTTLPAAELAPLAASWRNPPGLQLSDGREVPYDQAQRAYVLPEGLAAPVKMTLRADKQHPVFHVAFVVPGWSGRASMRVLSGAQTSTQARIGQVDQLGGSYLVIYLPITADSNVEFELRNE